MGYPAQKLTLWAAFSFRTLFGLFRGSGPGDPVLRKRPPPTGIEIAKSGKGGFRGQKTPISQCPRNGRFESKNPHFPCGDLQRNGDSFQSAHFWDTGKWEFFDTRLARGMMGGDMQVGGAQFPEHLLHSHPAATSPPPPEKGAGSPLALVLPSSNFPPSPSIPPPLPRNPLFPLLAISTPVGGGRFRKPCVGRGRSQAEDRPT